jgi:hypothetical protein
MRFLTCSLVNVNASIGNLDMVKKESRFLRLV